MITFFCNKRNGPSEYIHKIRQKIRMLAVVELLDVESVLFEFNDCAFVIVDIAVIRCRKNSDN